LELQFLHQTDPADAQEPSRSEFRSGQRTLQLRQSSVCPRLRDVGAGGGAGFIDGKKKKDPIDKFREGQSPRTTEGPGEGFKGQNNGSATRSFFCQADIGE